MSGVDPRLRAHFRIGEPSDEHFVEAAFELVLRRPPDADAREIALSRLGDGTLSRAALLRDLVTAPEFDRVRQLDDVIAFARGSRTRGERPRHLQAPTGTDERLVEVPWVLSRLRSGRVLEVGYAFAEPAYLAGLVEAAPGSSSASIWLRQRFRDSKPLSRMLETFRLRTPRSTRSCSSRRWSTSERTTSSTAHRALETRVAAQRR